MLKVIGPTQLCPDCFVIRTQRSRHCSVCNRCVERFDHHCPWINNCVGIRNHNYFLGYIIWQLIVMTIAFSQACQVIKVRKQTSLVTTAEVASVYEGLSDRSALFWPMIVILFAIICLFIFPLMYLVLV
mmetsp:Transcript_109632/g.151754  ORF Transcript_109632/g.151754 Transcript_109632/m.151754 type:complete len:129 (-) Transcript_109632:35-421(-)